MSIRQSSEIVRRTYFLSRPNTARACVKSVGMNFGNDHIFDMANFDETSRWMGWSKNEFSHSLVTCWHSNRLQGGAMTQETRTGRFIEYQRLARLVSQEAHRSYTRLLNLDASAACHPFPEPDN